MFFILLQLNDSPYLLLKIGSEYPFPYIFFNFLCTPEASAIQFVAGMYLSVIYGFVHKAKLLGVQALAKELGFVHPRTGEWMQFDSPLPPYFTEFLTRLRKEHRA